MLSFTFSGKDSYEDFGIYVEKRPNLPSPKRRVSYMDVPGRDSSLRYDEGTYGNWFLYLGTRQSIYRRTDFTLFR